MQEEDITPLLEKRVHNAPCANVLYFVECENRLMKYLKFEPIVRYRPSLVGPRSLSSIPLDIVLLQ